MAIQTKRQQVKGGVTIEVNDISTLFPKSAKGVINWFVQDKATNIDKEKTLNYLHLSAPIAEALNNSELISAAKVVESFENPKVESEKVADEDNTVKYSIVDESMPESSSSEAAVILDSIKTYGLSAQMSIEQTDDLLMGLYNDISESTRRKVNVALFSIEPLDEISLAPQYRNRRKVIQEHIPLV